MAEGKAMAMSLARVRDDQLAELRKTVKQLEQVVDDLAAQVTNNREQEAAKK